jgi:hypothetical protein
MHGFVDPRFAASAARAARSRIRRVRLDRRARLRARSFGAPENETGRTDGRPVASSSARRRVRQIE